MYYLICEYPEPSLQSFPYFLPDWFIKVITAGQIMIIGHPVNGIINWHLMYSWKRDGGGGKVKGYIGNLHNGPKIGYQ